MPSHRGKFFAAAALAALAALFATSPAAPKTTGPDFASPPDMIVLHSIGGPVCDLSLGRVIFNMVEGDAAFWKSYMDRQGATSIHYVIGRDGTVAASIPETQAAVHAGGRANARSIGIELVNRGDSLEEFPEAQVAAAITLVKQIRSRHVIPLGNVITHADVDQRTCTCGDTDVFRRRQDPGSEFPMERLLREIANPGETAAPHNLRPMTGAAEAKYCVTQP
jgi:N-acetyl-anhydromuramyl-L-alanine amidase AmpD